MYLIFVVFTKEDCIYENQKQKEEDSVCWDLVRMICFVYGRVFREEFSVETFFRYHFLYGPAWQRTVRMKLFLKLCGFPENLVYFNRMLLQLEPYWKSNIWKNRYEIRRMIENIDLRCIFFFFFWLIRLWKNEWVNKIALLFCCTY